MVEPRGEIIGNASLIDSDTISAYDAAMHRDLELENDDLAVLRGIPERGTVNEGKAPANVPVQIALVPLDQEIIRVAQWWAQRQCATYLITGITKDPHAHAENIRLMTTAVVDIDHGDIVAAVAHAVKHLGEPSFMVQSGGTTPEGQQKVHLYWLLREPTDDIAMCMRVRDLLARKLGGDRAFGIADRGDQTIGRAHQPIRIPGTAYMKGDKAGQPGTRVCKLVGRIDDDGRFLVDRWPRYELRELLERVEEMPYAPGQAADPPMRNPHAGLIVPSMKDVVAPREEALRQPIAEGGDGDRNRWTEFSRVAGGYIADVRDGRIDLATALGMTVGWAHAMMQPPWPMARIEHEFKALEHLDMQNHGAPVQPAPHALNGSASAIPFPVEHPTAAPPTTSPLRGLPGFTAAEIAHRAVPKVEFLVDRIMPAGEITGLISDGEVGKTTLMLQLAAIMAGAFEEPPLWLGRQCFPTGGTAILLSAEDRGKVLESKLHTLLTAEQLERAGDRLRVISLLDMEGRFPLVQRKRKMNRASGEMLDIVAASEEWQRLLDAMVEYHRTIGPICWLGLDTYSAMLHDSSKEAHVTNQFFDQAQKVCRATDAGVMLSHHFRKHGDIDDIDAAMESINGSVHFTTNLRSVIPIWQPPNWVARLRSLNRPVKPKSLFLTGLGKGNLVGERTDADRETTLVRTANGLLEAVDAPDFTSKMIGAMVLSARVLVLKGAPITMSGGSTGVFENRRRLHPSLGSMSRGRLRYLLDRAEQKGQLMRCKIVGSRAAGPAFFDVPGGPLAGGSFTRDDLRVGGFTVDYSRWIWDEAREEWCETSLIATSKPADPDA